MESIINNNKKNENSFEIQRQNVNDDEDEKNDNLKRGAVNRTF